MYVERVKSKRGKKVYTQILLRESYREKGAPRSRVKHRTLLNLTRCRPEDVEAIEFALKHKGDLAALRRATKEKVLLKQERSVGAVWLLARMAERVGLRKALGHSQAARRTLWQILARAIDQGSRLSAARLAREHAACEILGLSDFDENDLYKDLDWLDKRQARIEETLFRARRNSARPQLFLYDVTSSYLEGTQNAYGMRGYNRDGKRGKLQIVVGLLTDGGGTPVSVEVFDGNTQDPKTVLSQIRKLAGRFGVRDVTFVGDRGMIKSAQIEELGAARFHYLTAITKPQIRTLLKSGVVQLEMFDEKICEVAVEGTRYILRRNPVRADEISASRQSKLQALAHLAAGKNRYLAEHPRAHPDVALRDVRARAAQLRVEKWVEIAAEGRRIRLAQDPAALQEAALLDGCYVLKTDVAPALADADQLHARYKDLTQVERAFRIMKTGHLEVRPVYVRTPAHTRAHVFIVMLAYLLRQELETAWRARDLTVEEAIAQLSTLCAQEVSIGQKAGYLQVPEPRETLKELFDDCDVPPPETLPRRQSTVATKRKLPERRLQR
jgi:hypothetical protein